MYIMLVNGKNGPMVSTAIKSGMNIDLEKIDGLSEKCSNPS